MAEAAVAGGRLGRVGGHGRRVLGVLAECLAAEAERRVLWLPVFFGTGIGIYFALTWEPPLWLGPAFMLVCAIAAAILARRHRAWAATAFALAVGASGFALIAARARIVGGPMIESRLGPVWITGRVVDIDALSRGWRLILAPDRVPGFRRGEGPQRLRLHIPRTSDLLVPGDRAGMRAVLFPVPQQLMPGGHDMQRAAYFLGIGGVGYTYGGAHRLGGSAPSSWREAIRHLRTVLTERITAVLPGSTGGVAAALITGKRGSISRRVARAFRNAGLAHLLVIAGLHLGLVAGFVFFTARALMALVPPLALRWPIKKIAAGLTLVVLAIYLVLSGARVPTERAFVMNGIVFAAILLDRLRLSMRVCAIAALCVLLIEPESLVGPSFQMSFGAVVALIAVYETFGARLGRLLRRPSLAGRVIGYCGAVVLTTVVATVGTEAFAIYHFHRLALYSPLANVLAVPLAAAWTMPFAVLSCVLMPFGLERLALVPMGWGIDVTIWIAERVAALPGNLWPTPPLPLAGLLLIIAGGLWLSLWRGRWRVWGSAAILIGVATMALTRSPDIVLADGGQFLAVRAPDGGYFVRGRRFARAVFAEDTGAAIEDWPDQPTFARDGFTCVGPLCRYRARGRRVLILTGTATLPSDCGHADAIVAQAELASSCRSAMPLIGAGDTRRQGAVALWLAPSGVAIEDANSARGKRPWVPRLPAREDVR